MDERYQKQETFDKVMWKIVVPFLSGFFLGFFAEHAAAGSVVALLMFQIYAAVCFLYLLSILAEAEGGR